ncbi:hypothetical protein NBRC111894_3761 [Sporolactobacillus inulinus]|uniref:Uncharacterized protein n=1 Tax=Sporolactobacillus inulinus TaxID=2078 RepID=A0A4Y1ZGE2_9BACL|nr:hypothetical protein NBRC111894_3761 [Sporolactobacillus inulinus]
MNQIRKNQQKSIVREPQKPRNDYFSAKNLPLSRRTKGKCKEGSDE